MRQAVLTSADVHETLVADAPIAGDERAVFAGDRRSARGHKAYETRGRQPEWSSRGHSQRRRQALAEAGIADGIMHRSRPGQGLRSWQHWRNIVLAPIRAAVERVFGTLKRRYGWWRARCRGLARNEAHLHLPCTAYNLRRAAGLTAA